MQGLQRILSGSSNEIMRGYVSYDFKQHDMTTEECSLHERLEAMIAFLGSFPFPALDEAIADYDQRKADAESALANLPQLTSEDEETIYRLVLREVFAAVTNVDIKLSMLVSHHLVPKPAYVATLTYVPYQHPQPVPNITSSINWARRALLAISGQEWLYMSWQIKQGMLLFSLH